MISFSFDDGTSPGHAFLLRRAYLQNDFPSFRCHVVKVDAYDDEIPSPPRGDESGDDFNGHFGALSDIFPLAFSCYTQAPSMELLLSTMPAPGFISTGLALTSIFFSTREALLD